MMTPKTKYYAALKEKQYKTDPMQLLVLEELEELHRQLQKYRFKKNLFQKILKKNIQGLYVWGSVGIGKTFLMDIFHDCLPAHKALRIHFHPFMQFIHGKLKFYQGKKDPLKLIARELAKQYDVLCFDEFFVNDIADAMILANLMSALFEAKLTLVTTSNVAPDDLYRTGLQRSRFLPAIEIIKHNVKVLHMSTECDYRVLDLKNQERFFVPENETNHLYMKKLFHALSEHVMYHATIMIHDREIKAYALSHAAIWFEFKNICSVPRASSDYLEIVKCYPVIFISNVPEFTVKDIEACQYFINFIDISYDHGIKLVMSAQAPIKDLNRDGPLKFEFSRTQSRLFEMMQEKSVKVI